MRFGIYCEMQNGFGVDYAKTVWDVLGLIEHADRLGYDVFSVIDHHFFPGVQHLGESARAFLGRRAKDSQYTLAHALPHAAAAQSRGLRGRDGLCRHRDAGAA